MRVWEGRSRVHAAGAVDELRRTGATNMGRVAAGVIGIGNPDFGWVKLSEGLAGNPDSRSRQ